ncbi:parB-like partition protein [mine drainage metagenome]|uniref:ParB-like partition protein n=2 Tax=mine drainage metagenome TaxID=410659 RepID=T1A769_9ZZZZ
MLEIERTLDGPGRKRPALPDGHGTTAVGMLVGEANASLRERMKAAETKAEKMAIENQRLQDGTPNVKVDPARVRASRFADRHPAAFEDADFEDLCERIRYTGGNTQAAKVRPIEGDADHDFEIASGHRRHAACLKLGLPFKTIIQPFTDEELVREMVEENIGRSDLTPFERGMHFAKLIQEGRFSSGRELAAKLTLAPSSVRRLLRYGEIDAKVIAAFHDPREIRTQWVEPMIKAYELDPVRIERECQAIASEEPHPRASDVFQRLTGGAKSKAIIASGEAIIARVRTINGCPAIILRKSAPQALLDEIRGVIERWAKGGGP